MKNLFKTAAAVSVLIGGLIFTMGAANAASITLSWGGQNDDKQSNIFTLDTSSTVVGAIGNIGQNADPFIAKNSTYKIITNNFLAPGVKSGTWDITSWQNSYKDFAIGLKAGNVWAVFTNLTGTSGTWSSSSHDLSHAVLYGIETPKVVPLPAAVWLFGSALLGMVGVGYRRKTQA